MRRDYNMSCPVTLNRFLLNHIGNINGATKLGRTDIKILKAQAQTNKTINQIPSLKKSNNIDESYLSDKVNDTIKLEENDKILKNLHSNDFKTFSRRQASGKRNFLYKSGTTDDVTQKENVLCDIRYIKNQYMKKSSIEYTVAHLYCKNIPENIFSYRNIKDHFVLWSDSIQTLEVPHFIEGNVIDYFMIIKTIRVWKNVSFIPSSHTNYILGYSMEKEKPSTWIMYNLDFTFSNLVFLPYCFSNHWCLLILNLNNQTILHLDPLSKISKRM